ncbi:hypothetical protein AF72_00905 [Xylella taiwanensis]|uniref:Uncharacterized protein n=1 Tax=Xylella taiwanensis TaxID=1444770 RepID=Z9JN92_9GAMM|nr:hypothetical protein AF72_00905 [Xylella taiwanensis]
MHAASRRRFGQDAVLECMQAICDVRDVHGIHGPACMHLIVGVLL